MGIVLYSLFAYGLTALLSLLVVGIIVTVSRLTEKRTAEEEESGEE